MEQPLTTSAKNAIPEFLSGGGEMGERIRAYDWTATPLGHPQSWPQSLKTCVRIMLTSPQPMFVWWGKETLINIYNDPYRFVLGGKHPQVLGISGKIVWQEIWTELWARAEVVFTQNEGTFDDALLLVMNRYGYDEETYFKFSYNPIPGDNGGTEGLFCACTEETDRVITERSLTTLRLLGAVTQTNSLDELFQASARSIGTNNKDFPFAIIYAVDEGGKHAKAAAFTGIDAAHAQFPHEIDLVDPGTVGNNVAACVAQNKIVLSEHNDRWQQLPTGAWHVPPIQFAHVPIKAGNKKYPVAVLTLALNPYRKFDEGYQNFIQLVADQISLEASNVLAYDEERKRAEALAELDRAKTAFFTNISHEFRTPLTLILGSIEQMMHGQDHSSTDTSQTLATTHRNAMRLLRLVNNLLDLNRLEAGRTQARYQRTDIAAFTNNLASNFRSAIESGGLQFQVRCDTVTEPVYVDTEMWEKIVLNLLSNAFKYTLKGSITLLLTAAHNEVVLTVADTGVGIPEAELPKMFERFHRVQNLAGRTFEGSGIGLSLAKELVGLHGGQIAVTSQEGRGTTFTVVLPTGKAHLPAEQVFETTPEVEDAFSDAFIEEATALVQAPLPEQSKSTTGDVPVVLVVDDNADMRAYIKELLRHQFQVVTAGNGSEALDLIAEQKPDLVLSDVMMPVMDGIQLLKKIKETPQTATLSVILISARAGEEARIEGFEIGADDYLTKPFSARELLARVTAQVNLARKRANTLQEIYGVFKDVPFAVAVLKGKDLVIEFINQYNLDIWQKTKEDVLGKPLFEARPEIREGAEPVHQDVYRTRTRFVASEIPFVFTRNGKTETRYFNAIIDPLFDGEGNPTGQLATSIDVTEQVLARKKIEESERMLQRVFSQAPAAIAVVHGPEHIFTVANPIYQKLFGRTEAQLLGNSIRQVWPEVADQGIYEVFEGVFRTGQPFVAHEYQITFIDNDKAKTGYYDFVAHPIKNSGGAVTDIMIHAIEITEHVLARQEIAASETRFRTLSETIPQLVWMTDANGGQEYASSRWKEYTGIEPTGWESWQEMVHPEDLPLVAQAWQSNLASGTAYKIELRLKSSNGEYQWHYGQGVPLRNEAGKIIKWIGAFANIHSQKTLSAQLENLVKERTRELERSNEDLQQFAHVASHDLKEPVRKVLTFANRLKGELGVAVPERANTFLNKIESSAIRMYSMIDGVLLYSSLNALEQTKELIDLNELVESIASDLEVPIAQKSATLQYGKLPNLQGSPTLIYQLFYNLINNSLKFAREDVPPVINISAETVAATALQHSVPRPANRYIKVTLQDNGIGFADTDAEKIFSTFTRLHAKDKYEGTGLGLSLCRKIVERHGGIIYATGIEGAGATFTMLFPE